MELKRISGGMLVQEPDRLELSENDLKIVTERAPTATEIRALMFALDSLQAREVECDRVRAQGANGWYRRRSNEPGGFSEDSGD